MGKIFYVMGKSASGKDTIYKKLHSRMPELKTVTMYTTRPIRDGEHNGVEYFFVDPSYLDQCGKDGWGHVGRYYLRTAGRGGFPD